MKSPMLRFWIRFFVCIFAMSICAFGTTLMLHASLGVNPWSILHQGLANVTPLAFGQASQVLGFLLVIICSFWHYYPGVCTVLYIVFFGSFVDLFQSFHLVSTPEPAILRWVMLLGGNFFLAFGSTLYLKQYLGAGPKDELMLLLTQHTSLDVGAIRVLMELTAAAIGFLLGGPFGVGTIVCALSFGPMLHAVFKVFHYDAKTVHPDDFRETLRELKGG